ncbi:unnamed protein product, partial [Rotaria sordida]
MAETVSTMNNTPPSTTIVQINVKQECPVQYVTVYNDRAELTRLVRYHFDNEGTYDLVLQGLSSCVDLTSFHVSGGTGKACTILEVSYQTRYEDSSASLSDTTPLDQLQTQLDVVQADVDEHAQELDRLKKQRTWLDGRASKLMNQEGPMSTRSKAEMSFSSTSFTIPRRSTINADGKPHKLTIGVLDLVSTFSYTIVPKLSLHAYLKASTLNTSDKYLLAGPASIFMN